MNDFPPLPERANILFVLMGSLGDVVRGFSLLHAVKAARPNCTITWLVEPKCKDILAVHREIDQVIVFDRSKPLRGTLQLVSEFRTRRFDVVLDLQRHFKSGLFSFLSGAKRRIGFHRKNAKELNWLFSTETIGEFSDELSKIDHYLKFLEPLGIHPPAEISSGIESIDAKDAAKTYGIPSGKTIVGFVMGSSWESKDWIQSGYDELAKDLLRDERIYIVLFGDKSQAERGGAIASRYTIDRISNLCGKTPLRDLAPLIKSCSVCIGPDSGPGHIASAVSVPYVGLFGPTSPRRTAPFRSEHLALSSSLGCSPCMLRECPGLDRLCMRLLSAQAVSAKAREILKSVGAPPEPCAQQNDQGGSFC